MDLELNEAVVDDLAGRVEAAMCEWRAMTDPAARHAATRAIAADIARVLDVLEADLAARLVADAA